MIEQAGIPEKRYMYEPVVDALRSAAGAIRLSRAEYPRLMSGSVLNSTLARYFPGKRLRSRADGPDHRILWLEDKSK